VMKVVRTQDLLDNFNLTFVAGDDGSHSELSSNDIARPGLEMTGFFEYYYKERVEIIGKKVMNYFINLTVVEQYKRANHLYTNITNGLVITNWMDIPKILLDAANEAGVPILKSPRTTNRVVVRITNYLGSKFAPTTAVHGVLVDIYGVGILIMGQSGVGKS